MDQSGFERAFASSHAAVFDDRLGRASEFSGLDLRPMLDDPSAQSDLACQYFTYAFSCAAFEVFEARFGPPSMAAGYSMGIYSACAALRAFEFEAGLEIVRAAYGIMAAKCRGIQPGLAGIIGLSEEDVRGLLPPSGEVELVNVNNPASMVVSGPACAVRGVLDRAAAEGALSVRTFPAAIPYHHTAILAGSSAELGRMLESAGIRDPSAPLYSAVDSSPAISAHAVASALSENLDSNIRWGDTFMAMARAGAESFIDPGPGVSIAKIARFLGAGVPMTDLRAICRA